MKPGIELDALVAEKVMGHKGTKYYIATSDGGKSCAMSCLDKKKVEDWVNSTTDYTLQEWIFYKNYSTDIAAAWEVVEKFDQFVIQRNSHSFHFKGWLNDKFVSEPMNKSAPHAICLASLKAKGVEIE